MTTQLIVTSFEDEGRRPRKFLEARKVKERKASLEPSKRKQPCRRLDFSSARPIVNFGMVEDDKLLLVFSNLLEH